MGQGYSLTTLSAGSAGIDIPELADLVYEKSLGTARFMKSIRARHRNGLVFVKVIMKPYPSMKLDPYVKAIIRERNILADVPNALEYQRILETGTGGYLVRQFIHSSLYDRMSTRPFLEDIEKKWIAYQLLCALRDCHSQDIFHGDIKTENILVTSWNWLYLSDFSSSFKPTFLPEDNPADFSFYFDTSGRRTCYLAPERFLVAGEDPPGGGVNWAMDIFSAGCVIAELFLEAPIFSLSQLFKYRKSEYSPEQSQLEKIEDPDIRELILHMIHVDPESRYSAEECLNFWRHKAFPEYFYSFLHQYMGLITDPSSGRARVELDPDDSREADERIDRTYLDFDKISYFLGLSPVTPLNGCKLTSPALASNPFPLQLDLPNYDIQSLKAPSNSDDGTLIFLTLVAASLRNTAKATARIKACDILLAFAERVPDEAKLDRILPLIVLLLNDPSDMVKVAGVRSLTQLLAMVQVVSPVNAYVFPEYLFPKLQAFIPAANSDPSPVVRAAYASCIASLAHSSLRILDMIQALRSDVRLQALVPAGAEAGWTEEISYHNLYDVAKVDLLDFFEIHTKALLTDSDVSVRRAFLGSVSSLCIFFGNPKANDVILSHLNTYLNDKDWILKCAFFEAVIGVATYVGSISLEEFILPLMVQSLTDPEDFVVERVLRSLARMAKLGLFQRSTTWDLLHIAVRFFAHPNVWIREAAVHFVVASTTFLSLADTYSIVTPLVRPFLRTNTMDISESQILDALKRPLAKPVYDMLLMWATKVERGIFWKSAARDGTFVLGGPGGSNIGKLRQRGGNFSLSSVPRNDEDEQWLSRLRTLGMTQEDEFKLMALKEYIWRVASRRTNEVDISLATSLSNVIPLSQYGATPQTVFFDRRETLKQRQPSTGKAIAALGERKTHTIADALLDASSTIDTSSGAGRKHLRSRSYRPRENGVSLLAPGQNPPEVAVSESSQAASPIPSSPSAPLDSQNSSTPASDAEPSGRKKGKKVENRLQHVDSATSTDLETTLAPNQAIKINRRPSAMSLLNRKDRAKAYPETATTSTTAVGKVDVPQKDGLLSPPSATNDLGSEGETTLQQYPANHTYRGNDPTILKLLDAVFAETNPTDVHDFGPSVSAVTSRNPIKKADGHAPEKPWRPQGNLVAMFGEHSGPINRVVVAPDHAFFVTASDDGTVKVWDTTRLEKNLTPRSRQTYRHAPGTKVKCITFVENTHTFVSAATDGSIHAVKIDHRNVNDTVRYGKSHLVREYNLSFLSTALGEYATWMEHFRSETHSLLLVATNRSRVIALDLRTMDVIYILENPVHHGTPTTFCLDRKRHWLLLGTTHGILNLWDLRFRLRVRAWGLPGGSAIHRLQIHPLKGRGRWVCVAGGSNNGSEIMVWDIDKVQCREVYRTATMATSTSHTANTARNANFTADTSWKDYEPWRVDDDRPEGMLGRFASNPNYLAGVEPSAGNGPHGSQAGGDRNGIRALAAGLDIPEDGQEGLKCGFLISGGSDRKIRFWDVTHPDASAVVSGQDTFADGIAQKPRYDTTHPTPSLTITTEWIPTAGASSAAGSKGSSKKRGGDGTSPSSPAGSPRPPRSTVISLQQQQLLKSHLDSILDVAILEVPYGMTVSVDRGGMIYVFQ
ncbi:VPS15 protein kinase [Polytolypa hystricis UAMH7299]|uniref:non-specific serine/threonine protein kinase n=1 Tax=Polytolypa hystricis (strain UAMH7299) TaxID=1447883 RepID=A0A2B7XWN5_POLH7|nr:VPS15 protein kinase [Polytolypa hystricis UAMH7299]